MRFLYNRKFQVKYSYSILLNVFSENTEQDPLDLTVVKEKVYSDKTGRQPLRWFVETLAQLQVYTWDMFCSDKYFNRNKVICQWVFVHFYLLYKMKMRDLCKFNNCHQLADFCVYLNKILFLGVV